MRWRHSTHTSLLEHFSFRELALSPTRPCDLPYSEGDIFSLRQALSRQPIACSLIFRSHNCSLDHLQKSYAYADVLPRKRENNEREWITAWTLFVFCVTNIIIKHLPFSWAPNQAIEFLLKLSTDAILLFGIVKAASKRLDLRIPRSSPPLSQFLFPNCLRCNCYNIPYSRTSCLFI